MVYHKFLTWFLKRFFFYLYHPFAFAYDYVAFSVSLGRWTQWIKETDKFLDCSPILELGFGPGHLQKYLITTGRIIYGIDESKQMVRQASSRLKKELPGQHIRLTCCLAQALPFNDNSFANIVSTFPSEYIFDPETIREIRRVLKPCGKAVILISAWITGTTLPDRIIAFLYHVSGQSPFSSGIPDEVRQLFIKAGLTFEPVWLDLDSSKLLFFIAQKSE